MEVVHQILSQICNSANEVLVTLRSNEHNENEIKETVAEVGKLLVAVNGMIEDLGKYSLIHGPTIPIDDIISLVAIVGRIVDSVESSDCCKSLVRANKGDYSTFDLDMDESELSLLFSENADPEVEPAVLHPDDTDSSPDESFLENIRDLFETLEKKLVALVHDDLMDDENPPSESNVLSFQLQVADQQEVTLEDLGAPKGYEKVMEEVTQAPAKQEQHNHELPTEDLEKVHEITERQHQVTEVIPEKEQVLEDEATKPDQASDSVPEHEQEKKIVYQNQVAEKIQVLHKVHQEMEEPLEVQDHQEAKDHQEVEVHQEVEDHQEVEVHQEVEDHQEVEVHQEIEERQNQVEEPHGQVEERQDQVEEPQGQVPLEGNDEVMIANLAADMMEATGDMPLMFHLKSSAAKVQPIPATSFFKRQQVQSEEILESAARVFSAQQEVIVTTRGHERQEHFNQHEPWKRLPSSMNQHFQSNILNMDSARMYETLIRSSDLILPRDTSSTSVTYKIAFLCPPSGGVVTGTQMFFDLTKPTTKVNWIALTSHPWKESTNLDKILPNDLNLFWEPGKWKFVFDQSLQIRTRNAMKNIVQQVKLGMGGVVDLIVGDLSPTVMNMGASLCEDMRTMKAETKKAILTEAAEIEIALWTLRNGGSLILSIVDPANLSCTIGCMGILSGLFQNVAVVFSRQSTSWIRPASLICSGYAGIKKLKSNYPDFTSSFFGGIFENIQQGNTQLLLDTTAMPVLVTSELVKMLDCWADQEQQRLDAFANTWNDRIQILDPREFQSEAAKNWMAWSQSYIQHIIPSWNTYQNQPLVIRDAEAYEDLLQLWAAESPLDLESAEAILERLCKTYMEGAPQPVTLNVVFNRVNTSKLKATPKETFKPTVSFSRFTSLNLTYDRFMSRKAAAWFPTKGFAGDIETGVPVTCISHIRRNVQVCLADTFGLDFDEEALMTDCFKLPTKKSREMTDAELHKTVLQVFKKRMTSLDRNDTLFLCHCPLTTRLLMGMICLFHNCFKETRLVVSDEMRMAGVLLVNFRGRNNEVVQTMRKCFDNIIYQMTDNYNLDMEPVPLESILAAIELKSLMQYNDVVLRNELKSKTNVLIGKLNGNCKYTPYF